ncbi:ESPR domain-containing protein, partial [Yersinia pekkanenii]
MNAVFKVIWSISLNVWVAVSELAKGRIKTSSVGHPLTEGGDQPSVVEPEGICTLFRKSILALSIGSFGLLGITPAFAVEITVMDQASLSSALSSGNYDKIILGADIALTQQVTVNMANQNVVIDG